MSDELDDEEKWIEEHLDGFVEADNWVGESLREAAKKKPIIHEKSKKRSITIRLDIADVSKIKQIASEQGLQYQTLVSSVLHRYTTGSLVDVGEIKKVFPML